MTIQLVIYFKRNYRLIAIDFSKQAKLKEPQKISFLGSLSNRLGSAMFFIIGKSEETTFSQKMFNF